MSCCSPLPPLLALLASLPPSLPAGRPAGAAACGPAAALQLLLLPRCSAPFASLPLHLPARPSPALLHPNRRSSHTEEVLSIPWHAVLVDEAHQLKNHKTKASEAPVAVPVASAAIIGAAWLRLAGWLVVAPPGGGPGLWMPRSLTASTALLSPLLSLPSSIPAPHFRSTASPAGCPRACATASPAPPSRTTTRVGGLLGCSGHCCGCCGQLSVPRRSWQRRPRNARPPPGRPATAVPPSPPLPLHTPTCPRRRAAQRARLLCPRLPGRPR